jgi:hypothetical protein
VVIVEGDCLIEKGVSDLFVVLTSEVIPSYLERDYKEIYDLEDDVTSFECMADDVARVWRLVEWHDKLAEIDTSLWKFLESDDPNDLELRFKESAWLLRLKERIEVELMLRKLRNEDSDEDEDDIIVECDIEKLLLSFCDFLLESVPSLDFLEKDNAKRLQLIEDFLENWSGKNE